jgi:hypothetical protein
MKVHDLVAVIPKTKVDIYAFEVNNIERTLKKLRSMRYMLSAWQVTSEPKTPRRKILDYLYVLAHESVVNYELIFDRLEKINRARRGSK